MNISKFLEIAKNLNFSIETDNQGQIVIYTGHKYSCVSSKIIPMNGNESSLNYICPECLGESCEISGLESE